MTKVGILVHVYDVEDLRWEQVMWGNPQADELGSLPMLCRLLLSETTGESIDQVVIYNGPSRKAGLKEGAYTKQFLLDNLGKLTEFPRFKALLGSGARKLEALRARAAGIIIGQDLMRTADEIAATAARFRPPTIDRVIQIACAGHAPRCLQQQIIARANGQIAKGQLWSVVASDVAFPDSTPATDIVIFEKPHLAYDPMVDFRPTAPEVLGQYFNLPTAAKQQFLLEAEGFMRTHRV